MASAVENVTLSSEELVQKVEKLSQPFCRSCSDVNHLLRDPLLVLFVFLLADQDPCRCGSLQREVQKGNPL